MLKRVQTLPKIEHTSQIHCDVNEKSSELRKDDLWFPSPLKEVVAKRNINTPRPRVLVIFVGGTAGCRRENKDKSDKKITYIVNPRFLEELLSKENFQNTELPLIHFLHFDPVLDSPNMSFHHWETLSKTIGCNYNNYVGFVVICGTDTMAYASTAVSFALENLSKPVVFTGAQIPSEEIRSDAIGNIMDSLLLAGYSELPEVVICFHNSIYRANRTTKWTNWDIDAFNSYNYPSLGHGGIKLMYHPKRVLNNPIKEFSCNSNFSRDVVLIHLFPGVNRYIKELLQSLKNIKGMVLVTYGCGNAPSHPDVVETIQKWSKKIIIVVVSECSKGTVQLEMYKTGDFLLKSGCVSGGDMTTECAFIKLSYLIGKGLSVEEIKNQMQTDLRGEITTLKGDSPLNAVAFRYKVIF